MTRRVWFLSVLAVGFVPRKAFAAGESSELLKSHLELIELRLRLGEAHPKIKLLKSRIDAFEASGVRITAAEANDEFQRLFRHRSALLGTFGLDHPEVTTATRKIGFLAEVLSGPFDGPQRKPNTAPLQPGQLARRASA